MLDMHTKFKIEVTRCNWDKTKYNATVYSKWIFTGWKLCRIFTGDDEEDAKRKAELYINDTGRIKTNYGVTDEYSIYDAIKDWWDHFSWRYLNFGFREDINKHQSKCFIPLKKIWHFSYPTIEIHKCTDLTRTFKCGWFNKLLHKWFDRHVYFTTCVTKSPFLPICRNNVNPVFAYYSMAIGWKDKFDTPRYEYNPQKSLWLFRLFCVGYQLVPDFKNYTDIQPDEYGRYIDEYWEQSLWTSEYKNDDVEEARKTWPWQRPKDENHTDYNNREMVTSWDDRLVHPKYRLNNE